MLAMLARVTRHLGKAGPAKELMGKALARQAELVTRCRRERPGNVDDARRTVAELAIEAAGFASDASDPTGPGAASDPVELYEDARGAVSDVPGGDKLYSTATMSLARLHLARGALDLGQATCLELLRVDPASEEATMLLADIMFQRAEHDTATYHFEALLERRPSHFGALARLMVLLGRAGRWWGGCVVVFF
jgi:tetratricopeptide repeat protein 21B